LAFINGTNGADSFIVTCGSTIGGAKGKGAARCNHEQIIKRDPTNKFFLTMTSSHNELCPFFVEKMDKMKS
jgi:hypothetical protein